jgi:hypothetical protein
MSHPIRRAARPSLAVLSGCGEFPASLQRRDDLLLEQFDPGRVVGRLREIGDGV